MEQFRTARVRFLVELGDLLKDTSPDEPEERTLADLAAIEREIQRFGGATYHVLGNHDLDNLSKAQVLARITNSGIAPGRSYYAFSCGGVRFLVTDANYLRDGRSYDHGNYDWREYNVPPAEMDWLRLELQAATEPVIILAHQPFDGAGDAHFDNRAEVRGVLENSGKVLAVFQGHHHPGGYIIHQRHPLLHAQGGRRGLGPGEQRLRRGRRASRPEPHRHRLPPRRQHGAAPRERCPGAGRCVSPFTR